MGVGHDVYIQLLCSHWLELRVVIILHRQELLLTSCVNSANRGSQLLRLWPAKSHRFESWYDPLHFIGTTLCLIWSPHMSMAFGKVRNKANKDWFLLTVGLININFICVDFYYILYFSHRYTYLKQKRPTTWANQTIQEQNQLSTEWGGEAMPKSRRYLFYL